MSKTHIIEEIAEWLKINACKVHDSLNCGTSDTPASWPDNLREYYRHFNGQKGNSDFLFQEDGNWLSFEDALRAQKILLDTKEQYDLDWIKDCYVPIVAYIEQMDSATVIDLETGLIGNIDIELHEFSVLFENIDNLFADLLQNLQSNGFTPDEEFYIRTTQELDGIDQELALNIEAEHRQLNPDPSFEQLFAWGMDLFRHKGDPQYGKANKHIMQLAKKYFEQIPTPFLSTKQLRDIAIFNRRYQQIIEEAGA
ncbi:hypothetical protein [Chitinilyticum litopenaei]|uniref:hypothetical protein n=1 Tax=Chitinilyticum litopenaei TaxID=1121276 RepID=UPI0011872EC1|nr:hypothetical protein [Chitinilyticum litopenaei]